MTEANTNTNKLRIEFIYRPSCNRKHFLRFLKKSEKRISQGLPIEYGLRITNISDSVFSGAMVSGLKVTSTTDKAELQANKSLAVRALNCSESVELWFDKGVIPFKGTASVEAKVLPNETTRTIVTYQRDEIHGTDDTCDRTNSWVDILYIQGELELIQKKTNDLILWLTIITVWESIFGLNKTIMKILTALHFILSWLLEILQKIISG